MDPVRDTPSWVGSLVEEHAELEDPTLEDRMDLAVALAEANVAHGGGPFGAVITDAAGTVVSVGWNHVIPGRDSTAHAEVVAMRRAQASLGTHDLSVGSQDRGALTLVTSCAPCIQCYGALYWSGIRHVVAGATKDLAEALGFDEGPVTMGLWATAQRARGITYREDVRGQRDVEVPFRAYRASGGAIY